MNVIAQATAATVLIGALFGGYFHLDAKHAPMSVMSELDFGKITGLMNLVRELGSTPEGCKELDEAILRYCARNQDNYVCRPDTIKDIKRKAGCG